MSNKKTLQIFIAYSRRDAEILEELRIHLKVLERIQNVKIWYDGLIEAGHDWEASIKTNLYEADIILLLISQNFLASDYCYDTEMTQALALHKQGKLRAIPIIARNSLWQKTPFAHLQALPKNGKPIVSDWGIDKEAPYLQIVQTLETITTELRQQESRVISPKPILAVTPRKVIANQVKTSTFTDPRDGQIYKTIELLGQTWLAENLNYDVGKGCWYYDNDPENGEEYGRLYTKIAARKACPPGWRLPNDKETGALINLKASYKSLIEGGESGFNAKLGGQRNADGSFLYRGVYGHFWSAEQRSFDSTYFYFYGNAKRLYQGSSQSQEQGFSVRCIKE